MKIATIVGARPQFVKAAAFSRKLRETTDWLEVIIHTGQHFDANMSEVFFEEMDIPRPDYNLNIHNLDRQEMIDAMKSGILKILGRENPDLVLVYGDTNSTLAGALAAAELGIKLAHVEAGLRSYNLDMPEEHNRVETDRLSDLLFVPATNAAQNLEDEGVSKSRVFKVGDIMFDAVRHYSQRLPEKKGIDDLNSGEPYILLTLHRQENTNDKQRLSDILKAVDSLSDSIRVIWPVHPRTRNRMEEFGLTTKAQTINPVGYFDILRLIKKSALVMTDSGGLQKEAFYMGRFCVTLRNETEWVELVEIGANQVCGTDGPAILKAVEKYRGLSFGFKEQPYGEGHAADEIIAVLKEQL